MRLTCPGGQQAKPAGASQAQQHPNLAAGWAWQELAQGHQIRVATVRQPPAALDKLEAEVAQMATERGQSQS